MQIIPDKISKSRTRQRKREREENKMERRVFRLKFRNTMMYNPENHRNLIQFAFKSMHASCCMLEQKEMEMEREMKRWGERRDWKRWEFRKNISIPIAIQGFCAFLSTLQRVISISTYLLFKFCFSLMSLSNRLRLRFSRFIMWTSFLSVSVLLHHHLRCWNIQSFLIKLY